MTKEFTASLSKTSERYNDWLEVFGTDEVELQHPIAKWGNFPNVGRQLYYEIDLKALTSDQRERLIKNLAKRFNLPEDLVSGDLDKVGCPILASNVIVSILHPQKWL